mmetsp:Transcript_13346/g.36830  ORF Transcript_13346/g.36830 Transcript_13346/m.36830 type:complete len:216 (+) Transcript_13346:124-771(+)
MRLPGCAWACPAVRARVHSTNEPGHYHPRRCNFWKAFAPPHRHRPQLLRLLWQMSRHCVRLPDFRPREEPDLPRLACTGCGSWHLRPLQNRARCRLLHPGHDMPRSPDLHDGGLAAQHRLGLAAPPTTSRCWWWFLAACCRRQSPSRDLHSGSLALNHQLGLIAPPAAGRCQRWLLAACCCRHCGNHPKIGARHRLWCRRRSCSACVQRCRCGLA